MVEKRIGHSDDGERRLRKTLRFTWCGQGQKIEIQSNGRNALHLSFDGRHSDTSIVGQ